MLFYPVDHAEGGDCRRHAGAAVVRPHRCPERTCGTCAANCSDGDGELSLQDTPVLCIPLSTQVAVPVGSVQTL